jgi:hypothetical protein
MKSVFEYISTKSREFDKSPLFVYLRDPKIDPVDRLQFVPCSAHFVLTFADLYHFFLTANPPKDRYEELINIHLAEEGSHWKWFLADLTNLDLDPTMRFTDALRFLWSDATIKTRKLAYDTCKLSAGLTSLEKLVMVHSIEATGRVALEAAVPAGREAAKRVGKNLVYFGQHHLDTERQHTLEEDGTHAELEAIALDDQKRAELFAVVDKVFANFGEFVEETFDCAKAGRGFDKIIKDARVTSEAIAPN